MVERLQRYRMLVIVYAIILIFGTREFIQSRDGTAASWQGGCQASAASCFLITAQAGAVDDSLFWRRHAEVTEVVAQLNPEDPDTYFLRGMQAMQEGDEAAFLENLEAAVASGAKHNGILLQYHAQYLFARGADWERVNEALNRWRENHPLSKQPLTLSMAAGPATAADEAVLRDALAEVAWVAAWQVQLAQPGRSGGAALELSFAPGETIDIREAIAAVTVLSLSPEQRASFRVTCATLVDCELVPRGVP